MEKYIEVKMEFERYERENTYLFYLKKKKKKIPSYVYCARLTETCHGTCILLLSRWSDCFYCSPHLYVALDKSVC